MASTAKSNAFYQALSNLYGGCTCAELISPRESKDKAHVRSPCLAKFNALKCNTSCHLGTWDMPRYTAPGVCGPHSGYQS